MEKLVVSTDPFHQQFVPIGRCRLAARVSQDLLGEGRVQVRWRDWLANGHDTDRMDDAARRRLFARYASAGRDRMTGRAAEQIADELPCTPVEGCADTPCKDRLLRSRHVHVLPGGWIAAGVCVGIVLGQARGEDIPAIWRRLLEDHADRPIVAALAAQGPVGLLPEARRLGYRPRARYAGQCHLCWDIRSYLAANGLHDEELAPAGVYQAGGSIGTA